MCATTQLRRGAGLIGILARADGTLTPLVHLVQQAATRAVKDLHLR
ncbi:MAG: hypothetical protein AB8B82_09820 [Roseovarius sp.]